ncbi:MULTISPECIES: acyl carrier protein [unclassified Streptomyces]|uniref:acyl carrier protein n=1 Tax=unclassified Streptomyces TaxID=2593676 RepID=UPI002E2D3192|nr:acyl carrier protein [Streptomyces sp. NBC_01429]
MSELTLMPLHERREIIEDLVVRELKSALLMTDEEELPLEAGFFDLGLTSLKMSEVKTILEQKLECEIPTTVLFRRPTPEQLIDHLTD